ncbi:MAG: hypothetical protein AB1349_01020 [Elusimicrobiota bacterium]
MSTQQHFFRWIDGKMVSERQMERWKDGEVASMCFLSFYLSIFLSLYLIPCLYAQEVSVREEQQILEATKMEDPQLYSDLIKLQKKQPRVYRRLVSDELKKRKFLDELKKTKPEIYEKIVRINSLEKKTRDLVQLYKAADSNERKAELKLDLKNVLTELFELKQDRYRIELQSLENQIKEINTKLEKRTQNKEKIINRRLEELLISEEELDW